MHPHDRGSFYLPKERSNWKDHPLAVAALSASSAAIFMATVVMPLNSTHLNNRLEAMEEQVRAANSKIEDQVSAYEEQSQRIKEKELQVQSLEEQLTKKEGELQAAINANLFAEGNPFPSGLRSVKLGDPATSIVKAYPNASIEYNDAGYYSVPLSHPVFSDITYYIEDNHPSPSITHIMLQLRHELDTNDLLQRMLVDALGQPKQWKREGHYSWKSDKGHSIYKSTSDAYVIMRSSDRLAVWPDE